MPDVGGQEQRKSGHTDTRQPFSLKSDRIRTADRFETDRIRTDRHRTENPDRIRTADSHRTGFSGKSGQKRDTDSAVRRRLVGAIVFDS